MKNFEANEEMIYELIIEDLDQTIDPEHKKLLDQWRQATPENEKVYQDFRNLQYNIDKLYDRIEVDPEKSWVSLDQKISGNEPKVIKLHWSRSPWFRIAAAIVFILGLGYYLMDQHRYEVISTDSQAAITNVQLPDGTQLQLNASTTVKYNKATFIRDRKLVLIKGEAFIQVAGHQKAPFHVDLGSLEARDIGTSFNISRNEKQVAVIVADGKVALTTNHDAKNVLLTPGKIGLYDTQTKMLTAMDNPNINYKAWIDKNFVFTEAEIPVIANELEQAYHTKIEVKGEVLKNRKLTARLNYQTVDSTLAVISASLQCKVEKVDGTYILYDK